MPTVGAKQIPRRIIHPGEHYVTQEPMVLTTLLGSCVSVCLFDPVAGVMGMNHFLLPVRNPSTREPILASEAGRYGLCAMEILVNGLLNLGAKRDRLRAKAFGGGNVLALSPREASDRYNIGAGNVAFVRQFLRQDGIPLLAEDLGGAEGRQIHFVSEDFSVYLRRIPTKSAAQIVIEEQTYLQRTLQQQGRQIPPEYF